MARIYRRVIRRPISWTVKIKCGCGCTFTRKISKTTRYVTCPRCGCKFT